MGAHSLLLSPGYVAAMLLASLEFWLLPRVLPPLCTVLGIACCVLGESLRKYAMLTAKGAFTHHVKTHRRPSHVLVTSGPYGVIRHPGYAGWAIWAVGTQLLLRNPICSVLFTFVIWRFFSERIAFEETALLSMFGSEWEEYRAGTPSGIPGVP